MPFVLCIPAAWATNGSPAGSGDGSAPDSAPVEGIWYTNAGSIATLLQDAATVAAEFWNRSSSYSWVGTIPDGWSTTAFVNYGSFARFESDLVNGLVPPASVVMYDPEWWDVDRRIGPPTHHHRIGDQPVHELQEGATNPGSMQTPVEEQKHPSQYLPRFVTLAHANGYRVIEAPGASLVDVPGADCTRGQGETREAAYLRCGLAGASAHADQIDVQFQEEECNTDAYKRDVGLAATQAHRIDSSVSVLSGLSTGWCNPTGDQIFAAEQAVRGVASGHFLAIPSNPVAAIDFFSRLAPVIVDNAGFSPSGQEELQGVTASWRVSWNAHEKHSVTDRSGMGLFDSGLQSPGTVFRHRFTGAGTYWATDTATWLKGTIRVPVLAWPPGGHPQTRFTIEASPSGAPVGFVFDSEILRPGSSTWESWHMGNRNTFVADAGNGFYKFRARLRRKVNGAASGWSPVATVDVG